MLSSIFRLSVSQCISESGLRFSMRSYPLQLSPLTRRSPVATSFVLRRLLSSEARTQIQKAIDASPLVLFMKGTPELPQCGFSRAIIQVLDLHGVPPEKMRTYNVLEDPELRNGIKEFSCVYSLCRLRMRAFPHFVKESGPQFLNYTLNPSLLGDVTSCLGVSGDAA
jgi:glutaredoxin-related protein